MISPTRISSDAKGVGGILGAAYIESALCQGCGNCVLHLTGGICPVSRCPLADQFDLTPNQVMRSVQLNDMAVLQSRSIWLCASCHTCTTRCPQQIDVTGVMDALRIESRKRGVKPAVSQIAKFQATQLMSLAFGQGEDKAAIKNNLTDPKPYLQEKGVLN